MKKISLLIMAVFISGVLQCTNIIDSTGPKESTGAISGMIIGGALANDMAGESKNKALATVLGAFVGGVIGQNIGAQLDERDRLLADKPAILHLSSIQQIKLQSGATLTLVIMAVSRYDISTKWSVL